MPVAFLYVFLKLYFSHVPTEAALGGGSGVASAKQVVSKTALLDCMQEW
jgi:hypothetical protein